jgi:sialidase-1
MAVRTVMTLRLFCLVILTVASIFSAEPFISHIDVFRAGSEGYHTYRIPAIVTTPDGSLLAFAEGRKENQTDPGGGDIDLVLKRSTDQGATWSALQVVDDPGEKWGASNPTPFVDRSTGRVWIAFNRWEPGHGTDSSRPGTMNNQTRLRSSDDNGRTWSAPRDITRNARDFDSWGAMFLGPGGAIQTRSGRLILPAAMCPDTCSVMVAAGTFRGSLSMLRAYAIYSDDHGETWHRGGLLRAMTDENQMVELADGSVMVDARQSGGDLRWIAISPDGGQTWSQAHAGQQVTPVATSIERFTSASNGGGRNRILWTGPAGPGRKGLVVRVSYDEGQTFVNERQLYGGLAAHSDLTVLKDGTAGVLWERGVTHLSEAITFTRFNLEFIEPPGAVVPVIR